MPTSLTTTVVIWNVEERGSCANTLLIASLASGGIIIILIYTESQFKTVSENIIKKHINEVNVLAST